MRTWRQIHAAYNRFRERYYLEAEAPLHVPPKADELQWAWARDPSIWAKTHFDEDDDAYLMELDHGISKSPRVGRLIILHELSHIRNPKANCTSRDRYWQEEAIRLANLGAFTREQVF